MCLSVEELLLSHGPVDMSLGSLCWLMIDAGWPRPLLAGGPELYKEAGLSSHGVKLWNPFILFLVLIQLSSVSLSVLSLVTWILFYVPCWSTIKNLYNFVDIFKDLIFLLFFSLTSFCSNIYLPLLFAAGLLYSVFLSVFREGSSLPWGFLEIGMSS